MLNMGQIVKLTKWCTENVHLLHRLTKQEMAELAKANLPFNVTPANMRAAIEAAELEIEPSRNSPAPRGEELIAKAQEDLRAMAQAVHSLYVQLGMQPSARIKELAEVRP